MMKSSSAALRACTSTAGSHNVFTMLPPIEIIKDVFCIPPGRATPNEWGIYRRDGTLVESTGFHRDDNGRKALAFQNRKTTHDLSRTEEAPDDIYFYAGKLHAHYGHFLLSTLSRFWPFATNERPNMKILVHEDVDLTSWFAIPHFAFCLHNLGIDKGDFYNCSSVTHVKCLFAPAPSFVEEHEAYSIFSMLCHKIARHALANECLSPIHQPIYLSKSELPNGVWRFENEIVMDRRLSEYGVKIVYPETLSLKDQIVLFVRHPVIIGSMSSGLHSAIFSWKSPKIICLSHGDHALTNYTMLDDINGISAQYFAVDTGDYGPSEQFTMQKTIRDPGRVADALVAVMGERASLNGTWVSSSDLPTTVKSPGTPRVHMNVAAWPAAGFYANERWFLMPSP